MNNGIKYIYDDDELFNVEQQKQHQWMIYVFKHNCLISYCTITQLIP